MIPKKHRFSTFFLPPSVFFQDDRFFHEHPNCLHIFKKALDIVYDKYMPSSFDSFSGALSSTSTTSQPSINSAARGNVNNQPVITQQMLTEAMAMAFGGGGKTNIFLNRGSRV